MDYSTRRAPLRGAKRIPLNVTVSPQTHEELGRIAAGNRSAAIEELVKRHLETQRTPEPADA